MDGAREILELTGPELDRHGWGKGPELGGGKVCLGIAMMEAATRLGGSCLSIESPYTAVTRQIARHFPGRYAFQRPGLYTIPAFNDHPDTTEEDIRLVLKHALEDVSS
jgi:hypothetical protein